MNTRTVKHLGYRCIGPTITSTTIHQLQHDLVNSNLIQTKKHLDLLSGKTRLDILYLLTKEPELCVCDMADILQTTVSAVSHQLRVLRENNLVETRRAAQTIFYCLSQETKKQLRKVGLR